MLSRTQQISQAVSLAGLALAGVAFWITRTPAPPVQSVNGIYRNSCCEPVTLKDGQLITSHFKMRFELRIMKYGLDTQMDRYVVVRDGKIVPGRRTEPGGFLFAKTGRSFTLCAEVCGSGREFEFKRE